MASHNKVRKTNDIANRTEEDITAVLENAPGTRIPASWSSDLQCLLKTHQNFNNVKWIRAMRGSPRWTKPRKDMTLQARNSFHYHDTFHLQSTNPSHCDVSSLLGMGGRFNSRETSSNREEDLTTTTVDTTGCSSPDSTTPPSSTNYHIVFVCTPRHCFWLQGRRP